MVNGVLELFDGLSSQCGLVKVETMGDSLCCVGLDEETATGTAYGGYHDVCEAMAAMAVALVSSKLEFEGRRLELRVGIDSGLLVAGVFDHQQPFLTPQIVGRRMPRYHIFGQTQDRAARVMSMAKPAQVLVTSSFASRLRSESGRTRLAKDAAIDGVRAPFVL